MSIAENDSATGITILSRLYNRTGRAYIIGITGPPGSGKSTLIAELAKRYAQEGHTIGIVAVDPTSQMTGGALLGDRIRMQGLASDPNVFIRSMATRGQVGGIARATEDVVCILDATSTEYIFVETVGAGQSDVDVKSLTHTTIVVTAPGLGDEIQALKAGIMEIGDIFVVNKADREDADRSAQEISSMIAISDPVNGWRPKVVKTSALSGEGVSTLVETIKLHAQYIKSTVALKKDGRNARQLITNAIRRYFDSVTLERLVSTQEFAKLASEVERRKIDPYTAARRILKRTPR
jgi:LAO/AO transport system kinase